MSRSGSFRSSRQEFSGHVTKSRVSVGGDSDYFQQQIEVDNGRIADLEATVQKYQMLQESMEAEMEEMRRELRDRDQQVNDLEAIISGFMSVCESATPEDAIEEIRRTKIELLKLKKFEEVDADRKLADLEKRRQKQVDGLYEKIEEHGKNIHGALQDIDRRVGEQGDDEISVDLCRNLENTNQMLASRLRQLNGGAEATATPVEYRPPKYESKGLGPALWMANKRDLLSLERQMLQVTRKLENAQRSCQFLTQENIRLLGTGCSRPAVTGTLF